MCKIIKMCIYFRSNGKLNKEVTLSGFSFRRFNPTAVGDQLSGIGCGKIEKIQ